MATPAPLGLEAIYADAKPVRAALQSCWNSSYLYAGAYLIGCCLLEDRGLIRDYSPTEFLYQSRTMQSIPLRTHIFFKSHARDNGYGISVTSSKKEKVYYGCAKGGKYRDTKDSNTENAKQAKSKWS